MGKKQNDEESISTPCVLRFANGVSAPTNLSKIHFVAVQNQSSNPFIYGESASMQYKTVNDSDSKYLLAIVPKNKNKKNSIIQVPSFLVSEQSKWNLERVTSLKNDLKQGGADSLNPTMTYREYLEKRVVGSIKGIDSTALFNSKNYVKTLEKRARQTSKQLKMTDFEEMRRMVGASAASSALQISTQYMPRFNLQAKTFAELVDFKQDLLLGDSLIIDQMERKQSRNKSLKKVWSVLEEHTLDTGAINTGAGISIKNSSEFTSLPNFLQSYFGNIIEEGHWNAILKSSGKKKKKKSEEEEGSEEEEEEKEAEKETEKKNESFEKFLEVVASDVPSIAQYYMILLGLLEISKVKKIQPHLKFVIKDCYVDDALDRKAVKKSRQDKFGKPTEVFPQATCEIIKKNPHLFLPKSYKALNQLILRFVGNGNLRDIRQVVWDRSTVIQFQIPLAYQIIISALVMCNFYLKNNVIRGIQMDTGFTTEKMVRTLNTLSLHPDTQNRYVIRETRRLAMSGERLIATNQKEDTSRFNPFDTNNFGTSLSSIKSLFSPKKDKTKQDEPEEEFTAMNEEEPKKTGSKKSKEDSKKTKSTKDESKKTKKDESKKSKKNEVAEKKSDKSQTKKQNKEEEADEVEEDEDLEETFGSMFQAFNESVENDQEFKADEDDMDDEDEEMEDLVEDEKEEVNDESSDEEAVDEADLEDDDELDGMEAFLGGDEEGEESDEEVGIKAALGKRKSKDDNSDEEDEEDDEAGIVKSNKKAKRDFEQDEEESEEEDE